MHPYISNYVLHGLAVAPTTLNVLLTGATDGEMDARPDADRFTLREVVAHLADWEPIWRERAHRILSEDAPTLASYDEGQFAIDRDYAHSNWREQLARYESGRVELLALFRAITPEQWLREGVREDFGAVSLRDMAAMILGHDGYHARQAIEYRNQKGAI